MPVLLIARRLKLLRIVSTKSDSEAELHAAPQGPKQLVFLGPAELSLPKNVGQSPPADYMRHLGLVSQEKECKVVCMPLPVLSIAQMREWEKATWASGQTEAEVIRRVGESIAQYACQLTRSGDLILILAGKGDRKSVV